MYFSFRPRTKMDNDCVPAPGVKSHSEKISEGDQHTLTAFKFTVPVPKAAGL